MMIRLLIRTPDDSPDLKLGYDVYMQSSLTVEYIVTVMV